MTYLNHVHFLLNTSIHPLSICNILILTERGTKCPLELRVLLSKKFYFHVVTLMSFLYATSMLGERGQVFTAVKFFFSELCCKASKHLYIVKVPTISIPCITACLPKVINLVK